MFQWYALADVCYAFLVDVPTDEDRAAQGSHFRRSYWFTRGWTLQELIAPARVVFLSTSWIVIGSKHRLASLIAEITRIRYNALLRVEPLGAFSVAERLSWASARITTRVEDRAYSLLGLFDIAMPTLYGEGDRAFLRLQEEIMRRIPDQSLLAWTSPYHNDSLRQLPHLSTVGTSQTSESRHLFSCKQYSGIYGPSLLAASLRAFSVGWNIDVVSHDEISRRLHPYLARLPAADFNFTPYGIRTQLPLIPLSVYFPAESGIAYPDDSEWYLAILGCEHKDFPGQLLGRVCYIPPSASDVEFLYCGYVSIPGASWTFGEVHSFDLLPLSPETIAGLRLPQVPQVVLKTVYISHTLHRDDGALDVARRQPHETIVLVLPKKTRDTLSAQGYAAELRGPDQDHPVTHSLTLSCDEHVIAIQFLHTLERDGRRLTVTAEVSLSAPLPRPASSAESGNYRACPATLSWTDSLVSPWNMNLTNGGNEVILSMPGDEDVVVVLKLRFATTDHYLLGVEFLKASESSTALPAEVEVEASPLRSRWERWSRSWVTGATLAPASSESSHQAAGTGGEARVPSL
ncbi:hypothetical protein GSI_08844 [Ganoderma sinense ZZ0214-1]|uniref:DUF8212 domain-containing protein n=1 Tax=Ganoderma sinense ZZ0214-1 TaxID=1077348 RepID=A0A2G8S4V0_9APHY|nr:hypothetical protein GSI_08844 [Ganoderma sinense ZZ0214-1]